MLQNTDTTKLQKLQTSSFSIENGIKLFDSRVEAIFSGPEHYGCALSIPVEEE